MVDELDKYFIYREKKPVEKFYRKEKLEIEKINLEKEPIILIPKVEKTRVPKCVGIRHLDDVR